MRASKALFIQNRDLYWWLKMSALLPSVCSVSIMTRQQEWTLAKACTRHCWPIRDWSCNCKFAMTMVLFQLVRGVLFSTVISLTRSVFSQMGNPTAVVTDNGSQLISSFLEEQDIQHIGTTIYPPERKWGHREAKQGVKIKHPYCTETESSVESSYD